MNGHGLRLLVPLAIVFALLVPDRAMAQRVYLGAGLGPAIRMDDAPNQFRFELEVGAYFDRRPTGFFLAFSPAQSYGAGVGIWTFPLRLGGMFDVYRSNDFTFQLGPTGTVGFALSDRFDTNGWLHGWFHMSVAFMLRFLLMDEKLAIFVRPVEFEFFVGDAGDDGGRWNHDAIRYVLTAGIHYHF